MRLSVFSSRVMRIILTLFLVSWAIVIRTYAQATPPTPEEEETLFDTIEKSQADHVVIAKDMSLIKKPWWNQGLLVRLTLLILRITVVLGVTMVIIAAIRLILAQWNTDGVKKTTQQIIWVGVWILLALSSFVLIDIVRSTATTLNTALTEAQSTQTQSTQTQP